MGESSVCTACGTALPAPDLAGLITCPSCGRVTRIDPADLASPPAGAAGWPPPAAPAWPPPPGEDPASAAWPAPPVAAPNPADQWAAPAPVAGAPTPPPPASPPGAGRTAGAGRKIGCGIVPIVIILIVGGVVVSALRSCDISTSSGGPGSLFDASSTIIAISDTATVLASDPDATDVALLQQESGSQTVRRVALVRFTPDGSEQLWQSESLGESVSNLEIAALGDTVFAAYDDQLLALDRASGETRWRATLHDKITLGCPTCIAAVGDQLVVRTTDAYLAAYRPDSAEPRWTSRLRSPQGSMSAAGDRLFVVDDPESADQRTQAQQLDPATGKLVGAFAPTCPASSDTPWELELSPGDQVREVPGSDDVVAAFGFGDGCVVRWSPASSTQRWSSRLNGASSFRQDQVLVGDEDLVAATTSSASVTIALDDGTPRLLGSPADTTVQPMQIIGRTLLGATATTRGTPKRGLNAYDLATGRQLWAVRLDGDPQPVSYYGGFSSDALFEGETRFLVQATPDGANVVTFEGEQRTFASSALDLATGELGPPVRRGMLSRYDSGTPSLSVEAIEPDRIIASLDVVLQALPAGGRGPVVGYPDGD